MEDLKFFCEKYKEEINFANEVITAFYRFIWENEAFLMTTTQKRLIILLTVTCIKEIETSIVCQNKGLLTAVPLLLKKSIEAWRYQIYYSKNKAEAEKYMYDTKYEKPKGRKLSEAIDKIITKYKIHKIEDKKGKFYQDFIRNHYNDLCAFSHMDIEHLKEELIDKEGKLDFGINPHAPILLNHLQTIFIILALEIEAINHIFSDDGVNTETINSKYKELIERLEKIASA